MSNYRSPSLKSRDDELMALYPHVPTYELAERFGMSENAIRSRAKYLRVAKLPGCHRKRVVKAERKPRALFSELLRRSVRPADKVLDLFCGTGPIFGAAYQHKCLATGVELDKAYYGESLRQINLLED